MIPTEGATIFQGKVQHWYLEMYILVFKKYIIKLTCEICIKIDAHVFEKTTKA